MTADEVAQALLALATAAGVSVAREFVAPGPTFAHDCALIAVHLESIDIVTAGQPTGMCAGIRRATFRVTYANDCVPVADDDGDPPDPADVTAWSVSYLANVDAIHAAVFTGVDDLVEECDAVSVGLGLTRGPTGGMASFSFPVVVMIDLTTETNTGP